MTASQSALYTKCAEALRTGYFWCLGCQHIVHVEKQGEPQQCCEECGSHRVVWHPPTLTVAYGRHDSN